MVCTSVFYFKSLIIRLFTTCLMYIKYPWCLVLYTLFLPPKIATAYMACEQHLHGSRTTLVRLASDTCTAHEQHLHGSRAIFALFGTLLLTLSNIDCYVLWHCLLSTATLHPICHDIYCRLRQHRNLMRKEWMEGENTLKDKRFTKPSLLCMVP